MDETGPHTRMDSAVEVRRATVADLKAVKAVRLRALGESPGAFGSTLAQEVALTDEAWRARLDHGAWFLAWRAATPVGLVSGFTPGDAPDQRHLVSMWVEPAVRGTATATRLVEAVLAWAEQGAARLVTLWVADGNDRALAFYRRLGFTPTGRRQALPSDPAVGEQQMSRALAAGTLPREA